MPKPIEGSRRYMPGLDGVRAIAVLAVIAYHLGIKALPGGLLGVGVFFTLSGYLITDLLLDQVRSGGIRFEQFWLARARRLFPALGVMLIAVMAWVTVVGPHQSADFRDAFLTSVFYVNNWWLIFHDVSYFQRFAAPQPLNHLWSLSVEEQFYLVWPFVLMIGLKFVHEARRSVIRPRLALATLSLAAISAIVMVLLFEPDSDPSRVYYGTDTRAQELLAGAAMAMVWPSQRLRSGIADGARNMIDAAGATGLVFVFAMFAFTSDQSPFLYRGGFLLLSVMTAILIAAVAHPASRLALAVGWGPIRWIGVRSYGIYLWHFPVIALTTPAGAKGFDPFRAVLQVAAVIGIAALSWKFIEEPIRHGALGRWLGIARTRSMWRELSPPQIAGVAIGGLVAIAAVGGLAGIGTVAKAGDGAVSGDVRLASGARPPAKRISCTSVAHIGDSTSTGLESSEYLPNRRQRISAQYQRVGAGRVLLDISDARSVVEKVEGRPNAQEAATALKARMHHGCWVLALGLNEADDVYDHSPWGFSKRIDLMMKIIGNDPVMWVNVKTLLSEGGYSDELMRQWNAAVVAACDKYPNMRAYDWPADARNNWYISDQIHFTSDGYAHRARYIADALLRSFPAYGGPGRTNSRNCLIALGHGTAAPQVQSGTQAGLAEPDSTAPAATGAAVGGDSASAG